MIAVREWKGIIVTFIAFMFVHAGRKAFTNTKSIAIHDLGMDPRVAGSLDAAFMLAYALGLVVLGGLGDKHSSQWLLGFSLLSMGTLQLIFSELCLAGFGEGGFKTALLFAVWISDGLVQSLAWPCCVKIVQACLLHGGGTVFSIWACNGVMGNILCSGIAALLIGAYPGPAGFRGMFIITTICNILITYFVGRLKVPTQPSSIPQSSPGIELEETVTAHASLVEPPHESLILEEGSSITKSQMTLMECLKTRGVIDFSVCNACIKAVCYAMFFWLPFYLSSVYGLNPGKAAGLSIVYDVATLIGGPACGYLVDRTHKPATIIAIFVLLAAGPQLFIQLPAPIELFVGTGRIGDGKESIPTAVFVNIILSGFFVGGVLNVLSAAVCAKIGGHGSTSRVTGVIDGIGSFGAAITQIMIPLIGVQNGWTVIFVILASLLVLSAVTLFRIVRDEWSATS
jgi:OPA family glycerol-3-phosphate transporter-like MFS transporter 3